MLLRPNCKDVISRGDDYQGEGGAGGMVDLWGGKEVLHGFQQARDQYHVG